MCLPDPRRSYGDTVAYTRGKWIDRQVRIWLDRHGLRASQLVSAQRCELHDHVRRQWIEAAFVARHWR